MAVGLSTYAFFWQWSERVAEPLSLEDMLERTAELGVDVFQICDYPLLEERTDAGLRQLSRLASDLGIRLELGTKGVGVERLERYLRIADALDVTLVRSMWNAPDHRPDADEAEELLRRSLPAFESGGVVLALETYEQVPTSELVGVVERVGSTSLGICSDPANCVAALETPRDMIAAVAPHVRNMHVKDFAFTREAGWVGFSLVGARLGEGLLDYDAMLETIAPASDVNQIVEHWLPWQGDAETTIRAENDWTAHAVSYLRRKEK